LSEYADVLSEKLKTLDYAPARLYLAGALYDCTGNEEACQILADGMLSENVDANKIAIQILLNVDIAKAKDLRPIVDRHVELYGKAKSHGGVEFFLNVLLLRLNTVA